MRRLYRYLDPQLRDYLAVHAKAKGIEVKVDELPKHDIERIEAAK